MSRRRVPPRVASEAGPDLAENDDQQARALAKLLSTSMPAPANRETNAFSDENARSLSATLSGSQGSMELLRESSSTQGLPRSRTKDRSKSPIHHRSHQSAGTASTPNSLRFKQTDSFHTVASMNLDLEPALLPFERSGSCASMTLPQTCRNEHSQANGEQNERRGRSRERELVCTACRKSYGQLSRTKLNVSPIGEPETRATMSRESSRCRTNITE
ncbi:hypothetical protein FVE85_6493 [Porphyridium purpureum]|uniref:Uncharacterized protein n=1 Tax=Porphyridium purpureum TaxID=35688 RepID=A0A5J4Z6S3_PORPP|nr:hypothetical protein FVE85_6493 [Porphyridium purpureum]|eukprot:POR6420..scf295_1